MSDTNGTHGFFCYTHSAEISRFITDNERADREAKAEMERAVEEHRDPTCKIQYYSCPTKCSCQRAN